MSLPLLRGRESEVAFGVWLSLPLFSLPESLQATRKKLKIVKAINFFILIFFYVADHCWKCSSTILPPLHKQVFPLSIQIKNKRLRLPHPPFAGISPNLEQNAGYDFRFHVQIAAPAFFCLFITTLFFCIVTSAAG